MTSIAHPLKRWLNAGLGLVYPEICQLCREQRATAGEGFVCPKCWGQVQFIRAPFCEQCGLPFDGELATTFACSNCREMELHFRFARAAVVAKTVVRDAIHRFKYSRALWFENFLAGLLLREAAPVLANDRWDLIMPVPLHPRKLREREFNQATVLAKRLAAATGIPLDIKSLRRVTATTTQTQLSRAQRAANMKGAFAVREGNRLDGKRIVIVDDVLTTGATTNACAGALRRAGASDVCVWTVARGL